MHSINFENSSRVAPVPGGGRVDEVARRADLLVAGALGEAAQLLGGQQPAQELSDTMLTTPPVPYDLCVGIPISRLLPWVSVCLALVGAFNQEKALVGAFSVIVKSSRTFV